MHDFVCGESGAEGHAVTRGRRPAHPARVSPTADTEGTQGLQLPGQKPAFSLRAEKAGDALVFKCMSQRQRERRGRGREGGTGRRRGPRKWSRAGSWGTGPQHQRLGADPLWPVSAAPEPSPAVRAETWPPPRVRHGRRASPCLTLIPKRLQMLDGGGEGTAWSHRPETGSSGWLLCQPTPCVLTLLPCCHGLASAPCPACGWQRVSLRVRGQSCFH